MLGRPQIAAIFISLVSGCSQEANHLGNPLAWPFMGLSNAVQNATDGERRGRVEVFVKTNHPALIADIENGGGPVLSDAMDLALVADKDRDILALRLKSDLRLHRSNQEALIVALMVHGQS